MKAPIWLALVAASTLAVGCKKDKDKGESTETPAAGDTTTDTAEETPEQPAGDEHLTLSEASLTLEGSSDDEVPKAITIAASGDVKADDEVVATLSKTGEMTVDGKVVASIDKDGKVTFEGEAETMTIAADGSIEDEGKTMVMWNDDGTMGGELTKEMDGMTVKFEGAPEMRRPMTFAFMSAMLLGTDEAPVDDTAEVEAVPAEVEAEPAKGE